ncbi:MAG TPA: hypothetical protein VD841_04535 [Arthrobacter sp.]|nr:hypothetical protein [Arthrobacter sp.]
MEKPVCTYLPRDFLQPRGGRPWCATCDTDSFLAVDSMVVLDARKNTLAAAVSCSRCQGSRVLATTSELIASVLAGTSRQAAS